MSRASRKAPGWAAALLAAALALAAAFPSAAAPSSASTVLLLPEVIGDQSPDTAARTKPFADALRASLSRELSASGFIVADGDSPLPLGPGEPYEASILAKKAQAEWAAVCAVTMVGDRIVYRIALYDARETALAAGETFSAYAGLTAFPILDDSATRAAAQAAEYRDSPERLIRRPVPYRITVLSADEGAEVSLGAPGDSRALAVGRIEDGRLELPYYPFLRGSKVLLGLSAPGRRNAVLEVELGPDAPTVELPALAFAAKDAIYVGTGTGRLLGAGAGYRRYLDPDWNFLFAEDRLFAGYDFLPGSYPLVHEELWFGVGWYLIFPPESKFRAGACLGAGTLFSAATSPGSLQRLFVDVAVLPIDLFFEYNFGQKNSAWLSVSSAFSLGTGASGLLGRAWIGNGPPALSAGWMWRR